MHLPLSLLVPLSLLANYGRAQIAGSAIFQPIGLSNASTTSSLVQWQSLPGACSAPGINIQSPASNAVIVPTIGAASISAFTNTTLINFISSQNYYQSLVGAAGSNSSISATQLTSVIQQLVGLASNNASSTATIMNGFQTFFQQSVGGASTNATATFSNLIMQTVGAANNSNAITNNAIFTQLAGSASQVSSATACATYISCLVGLSTGSASGISNTTQALSNYMVALIGAANATSSSFTSLNAFLIQAVGTSSALNSSQSVAALGNFTTFVQASIGAAGNSTALTLAANSFNGFIVTNVGLSNITTIASYIQSLVGASNATTATINYIQTAFPGLANGTNLINYINANPGSSNATAANWINFLYTNCGPSSTSNLIQFNSLIQLAIGFKPIPTPSPVLQQLSSYPSTVDNTLLNNNLNLFLSYLMQIQTTQLVSIGFVSGVSLSTINYMPMLAYPGTSNYLVVIYYGNKWTQSDATVIETFLNNVGSSSWWSTLNQYQASSLNGIVNSLAVLNPYSSSSAAIISNTSANSTFVTIFNQFGVTLDFNKSDDSRLISSVIASGPTSWTSGYSACPAPLTSCSAMMRMPTYNSYVLLTSDDINVINVGSTGDKGTMGKGLYGYHSSTTAYGYPSPIYYMVVGKLSQSSLISNTYTSNILYSPNSNPLADFAVLILAHEIAELITNPGQSVGNSGYLQSTGYSGVSDGRLLEVADQCAGLSIGTSTYCSGSTSTSVNCSSGTFIANSQIGSKLYLLPAIWSITSQQCIHQPLAPITSLVCNNISPGSRVTCGDNFQNAPMSQTTCQSLGCCWNATDSVCFHNTRNVQPSSCPFIPNSNRLDCGYTTQTTCNNAGCCWHSDSVGSVAGPSCYRQDVFKQGSWLSNTNVYPYIPLTGRQIVDSSTPTTMYDCTRFNSNGIWMPSVGQGYTSSCYFNTYSPTGLGYTYKSLSTGNLVYCNGLTSSSTTNLTGSYPTADKCLSAGYCWQVDYATSASQFVLPSTYPPPQQSMGCYPGDAGWSIGPSSSPAVLNAGTSFYLSDGSGNMVSLDSTGKVVLGTAGIPLNLQSVSSTGSSNWPLTPGPWTALYSPYLNAYLSSNALNSSSLTSTTTTMSLTSNWTIVVNPSNPSLNYLLNPNGCYLAWDNVNQVSYCSTSISKATGFVISTTISITSTWITSLGCYMDSSSRTLNSASMTSSTLTPQSCVTWCLNQGYTVAGIEMGAECYCSKSVNGAEYAPTQTDCPSTGVGTNWRLNVYTADPKITKPLQNLDANGYCTVCSSDGNKAMFSGNSTGTLTSNSGTNQPVSRNSILLANGVNLVMQNDGNLVLYSSTAHSTAIFSSNTWTGVNGFKAMMQTDGNFVVYNQASTARFSTNTGVSGSTGKSCMVVMPEGDMALFKSSNCAQAAWQASKGSGLTSQFKVFNPTCGGATYCSYHWYGSNVSY